MKNFNLNTPMKLRPKKITTRPDTRFTMVWWRLKNMPRVPASAPIATKSKVKPNRKENHYVKKRLQHTSVPNIARLEAIDNALNLTKIKNSLIKAHFFD